MVIGRSPHSVVRASQVQVRGGKRAAHEAIEFRVIELPPPDRFRRLRDERG